MGLNPRITDLGAKVRLEWTPDPTGQGYRLYVDGNAVSRTFKPEAASTTFAKPDDKPHRYGVQKMNVVGALEEATWPQPPPPSGGFTRRQIGALRYGSLPPPSGPERYDLFACSWWEIHQFRNLSARVLHYMSTASVGRRGAEIFNVDPDWARANGLILKTTLGADAMNAGYGWPLGDIGHPAFQEETARVVAARVDEVGAEGVFFDDMQFHWWGLTRNAANIPAKYPTQPEWWAANVSFAKAMAELLAPRYVAFNCGGWFGSKAPGYDPSKIDPDSGDSDLLMYESLAPYADAVFCEGYQTLLGVQGIRTLGPGWNQRWDLWQRLPRRCAELGLTFLGNAYNSTAAMADYVLCSLLLEADAQAVFMWDAHGGDPWHPFYDQIRALGKPTGVKRQNGTRWERPHEGGLPWLDPSAGTYGIQT